jgi:hypothetical protein
VPRWALIRSHGGTVIRIQKGAVRRLTPPTALRDEDDPRPIAPQDRHDEEHDDHQHDDDEPILAMPMPAVGAGRG